MKQKKKSIIMVCLCYVCVMLCNLLFLNHLVHLLTYGLLNSNVDFQMNVYVVGISESTSLSFSLSLSPFAIKLNGNNNKKKIKKN